MGPEETVAFALKGHLMRGCGKALMGCDPRTIYTSSLTASQKVRWLPSFHLLASQNTGLCHHLPLWWCSRQSKTLVQTQDSVFQLRHFFFKSHLGSSNGARLVLMISCRVEETAPGTPRVCGLHFSSYSFSLKKKKKLAQTTG